MQPSEPINSPGLMRRLTAMFYDTLLVTALWIMLGMLLVFINGNEPINSPILPILLPVLIFAFYAKFWMSNGQTLGMQTWKFKLVSNDGNALTLKQCLIRCLGALVSWACFGMGYWWIFFDKNNCSWHDRWSNTRLVIVDPKSNS